MSEEFDFTNAVTNPFIDSIRKNGYAVTVHYPPLTEKKLSSYEEIIEEEMETYRLVIYEKTKDMTREQLIMCLDKIFEAIQAV